MKFKSLKKIVLFVVLLMTSLTITYGSYIIKNLNINGDNEFNLELSETQNFSQVNFLNDDGDLLKKVYVNKNEGISNLDAPYIAESNGYYSWIDESGIVRLDPTITNLGGISKKIAFDEEVLNLKAKYNAFNNSDLSNYKQYFDVISDDSRGSVDVESNNNISFNENSSNYNTGNSSSKPCNLIYINEEVLSNVNIDLNFKINSDNVTSNIIKDTNIQANNDTTIGLEDPTSVGEFSNPDYKPITTENRNYCTNRIVLNNDLILANGTTLTIGALTAFYGSNNDFSQNNFQGFIAGPYSELDLNGNTLLITGNSILNAYGSITDSKGTGKIIVNSGGKLYSTFVVEDQHHESSAPMTYLMGGPIFSMYRIPYINTSVYFQNGSYFYGNLRIDWGGSNASNYSDNIICIIGPSNSGAIFSVTSSEGYILREVTYDQSLKAVVKSNSEMSYDNIMYQKINVSFFDTEFKINFPSSLSANISGMNFNINLNKTSFNIPPYYNYYLYNSSAVLKNMLTFMPGSYLYVDELSEIKFTYDIITKVDKISAPLIILYVDEQYFANAAGMNFIYEKYDFSEAKIWNDSADKNSGTENNFFSGTAEVFEDANLFWEYVNKKHAYCDFYGNFTFDKIENPNNLSHTYELGGIINIDKIDNFKTKVKDVNLENQCLKLVSDSFKSGPDRLTDKEGIFGATRDGRRFNINDFYSNPLVSNGWMMVDINNYYSITNNFTQTFDFEKGIAIKDSDCYALLPLDTNSNYNYSIMHFYKSNYKTKDEFMAGYNDLTTMFVKVDYNSNEHYATPTEGNLTNMRFAYFHGCYVPLSGNKVNLKRFRVRKLGATSSFGNTDILLEVTYDENDFSYYGHASWRLK